jgi:hypothetical protein
MATYEQVTYNSADGAQIGKGASEKVAFYGAVPVAQRPFSSALHVSSNLATSSAFGATQLAVINEIQATLVALGIWASA